jgi:hypothetical protein
VRLTIFLSSDLLYDRFYVLLRHYGILKEKFTLLLNLYDYSLEPKERGDNMVYAGIQRQRQLLKALDDNLDDTWAGLKTLNIIAESTAESKDLIIEFKNGELGINDIHVQKLEDYFAKPCRME